MIVPSLLSTTNYMWYICLAICSISIVLTRVGFVKTKCTHSAKTANSSYLHLAIIIPDQYIIDNSIISSYSCMIQLKYIAQAATFSWCLCQVPQSCHVTKFYVQLLVSVLQHSFTTINTFRFYIYTRTWHLHLHMKLTPACTTCHQQQAKTLYHHGIQSH